MMVGLFFWRLCFILLVCRISKVAERGRQVVSRKNRSIARIRVRHDGLVGESRVKVSRVRIFSDGWLERGLDLLFLEKLPVYRRKEGVLLDVGDPFAAEPFFWLFVEQASNDALCVGRNIDGEFGIGLGEDFYFILFVYLFVCLFVCLFVYIIF